jgi:hypothetical protein
MLVLAATAIVAAVAGVAVAQPVATKPAITKKKVKSIVARQITELAPGLSVASAKTAENANTATTAGDADRLDGRDAADFTPAGEVHSPGRVAVIDATSGDTTVAQSQLAVVGPFTFTGRCAFAPPTLPVGESFAAVRVSGPDGYSSTTTLSNGPAGPGDPQVESGELNEPLYVQGSGSDLISGLVSLVAPGGQVVSAAISAELHDGIPGRCSFGITALGP